MVPMMRAQKRPPDDTEITVRDIPMTRICIHIATRGFECASQTDNSRMRVRNDIQPTP